MNFTILMEVANPKQLEAIDTVTSLSTLPGEETSEFSEFGRRMNDFLESNTLKLIITIIWSLLVLFGTLGNGLVIFIAVKYKKLNDITNCYIFNLAITDLLFIFFCIPFTIYMYTQGDWLFGTAFCKLNHFMSHVSLEINV